MKFILLLILLTSTALAQTGGTRAVEFDSVQGIDYNTNIIINPSGKRNAANVTTSSAAVARVTTAGYQINGVASLSCDASALNGYCEWTINNITSANSEGNCEFKGLVKGDGSLYQAQILNGSSVVLAQTQVLGNQTTWTPFSVNYVCGASRQVRITQTVAGTAPAINLGKLYYGQATNIGSGIAPNTFSAQISNAGVVSNESGGDFINGNCALTDTSFYTCTFNSGFFTSTPTCTFSNFNGADPGTTVQVTEGSTTSASSVIFRTLSAGAKSALFVSLTCTKTGSDYSQNTITANNYDYTRRAYTPTFTGLGTVTSISCFESRSGAFNNIDCKFTTGTATATEARISLPGSNVVASSVSSIRYAGMHIRDNTTASSSKIGNILMNGGQAYVTMSVAEYSQTISPLVSQLGNALVGSGTTYSVNFSVPIEGWSETQNAPQLLGSVTSNANGALRIEGANLNCAASSSITSQTSSTFVSSIGNVSAGACAITFATPFGSAPYCTVTHNSSNDPGNIYALKSTTASGTTIDCDVIGVTDCTAYDFFINCLGSR
jgi:hypothetical protein